MVAAWSRRVRTFLPTGSRNIRTMSQDFFNFTSGRFLYNEPRELARRYLPFDVDALKSRALACTGAEHVLSMEKINEGRYNRVFRLRLSNAQDVVARLAMPITGRLHDVTISEVATMKLLRERLGVPVPKVLGWSSSNDPVGAEYIIMELVDGVELSSLWQDLDDRQRLAVVKEWFDMESRMIKSLDGTAGFGSLYLRSDVSPAKARPVLVDGQIDSEFVLGPCVSPYFMQYRRDELDIDRGPCT